MGLRPFFGDTMKFKYNGDVKGFSFRGYNFPIGKAVDVKDDDVIEKCKGNSHFDLVKSKNKAATDGDKSGNKG